MIKMNENTEGKNGNRSRGPNFTKEEQILLFTCVESFGKVIECKKSDAVKHVDKQKAWSKVTDLFNSNTRGVQRSVENLQGCYRNAKSKIKKEHSEAKMMLKDTEKKEALINALDENGKNWDKIATSVNQPIEVCKKGYEELEKEIKTIENKRKIVMMKTGGGPGPSDEDDYNPVNKLKKLIEPQIDGMYTIYDGDADLMALYQKSIPEEERVDPIEAHNISILSNIDATAKTEPSESEKIIPKSATDEIRIVNRTDILRKKKDLALMNEGETATKKKKTASESFRLLAEEKIELIKIQKDILKRGEIHRIQINELELKIKLKELELLELRIKNESNIQ